MYPSLLSAAGEKSFLKGLSSSANAYAKQRAAEWEEEEERRKQAEAQAAAFEKATQENLASGKKADGSDKNFFEQAGDVIGAGANIAKDAAVGAWNELTGFVDNSAKTIEGAYGATQLGQTTEIRDRIGQEHNKRLSEMVDINNPNDPRWDSPQVRELNRQYQESLDALSKRSAEGNAHIAEGQKVDAKEFAGQTANTFLNLATAGAGGLARSAGQSAVRKIAGNTLEGGIYGATGGAFSAAQDEDQTLGSTLQSVGSGALFGSLLGGGTSAVGEAAGSIKRGLDARKTAQSVTGLPTRAEVDSARVTDQASPERAESIKQLEAGYRSSTDVDSELTRYQKQEFTPEDDVWQDNPVTLENGETVNIPQLEKDITAIKSQIRDLEQQATGETPNGSVIPEGADPSTYTGDVQARTAASDRAEVLKQQLTELEAQRNTAVATVGEGNAMVLDPAKVRARFSALQEEANVVKAYEEGRGLPADTPVRTNKEIQAERSALNDPDTIPADLRAPYEPTTNLGTAMNRARSIDPEDTMGLQAAGRQAEAELSQIDGELQQLNTMQSIQPRLQELDSQYLASKASLEANQTPRTEMDIQQLTDDYMRQYEELMASVEADSARANDLISAREEIQGSVDSMVERVQQIEATNPAAFREVDPEALTQRKLQLDAEAIANNQDHSPSTIDATAERIIRDGYGQADRAYDNTMERVMDEYNAGNLDSVTSGKNPGIGATYAMTNRDVLRSWGKPGQAMADTLDAADTAVASFMGDQNIRMRDWDRLLSGKQSQQRVALALDGDKPSLEALNPPERQVYDEMKASFEEFADRLGIPQEGRISDYFPHVFGKDMNLVQEALAYIRAGKKNGAPLTKADEDMFKSTLENIDARTLEILDKNGGYVAPNGFLKKRAGAEGFSLNLFDAYNMYARKAANDIYYKPAFDLANDISKPLSVEQTRHYNKVKDQLLGYTESDIENSINATLENMFGTTRGFTRGSRAIKNGVYNAMMGVNVRSAIQNLEQTSLVYGEIGADGVAAGLKDALSAGMRPNGPAFRELVKEGVLSTNREQFLKGKSSYEVMTSKGDKILWGLFNSTERFNRGLAYFGAKNKALAAGKTMDEAIAAGRDASGKANFDFSAMDLPQGWQSDTAKLLFQFQTFNLQKAQYLAKFFNGSVDSIFEKTAKGKYQFRPENAAKLARATAGTLMFYGTAGAVIGSTLPAAVPFLENFMDRDRPRSPIEQLVLGNGKGQEGVGSIAAKLFKGEYADDADALGRDVQGLVRAGIRTLVPGGNQTVKTVEGLTSSVTGESRTASGNLRFQQDQDPLQTLNAGVFGQYNTPAARRWLEQGMNTLPKQDVNTPNGKVPLSEYVSQLPPEKKQQYFEYYNLKQQFTDSLTKDLKRTAVRDKLVEEYKAGNITERELRERATAYNQEVYRAIAPYFQKYSKLPLQLEEDLNSRLLLNVESAVESAQKTQSKKELERLNAYYLDDFEL